LSLPADDVAGSRPLATRRLPALRVGLLLALCGTALDLIVPLVSLFRWVPRNYNEGWNAYWSEIALQGGTLYRAADSLIVNNYPPLSFYLVGWLGWLLGDNVIAGRLVSLAALGVLTLAVHAWLKAAGASREASLAGALFCLMGFATFGRGYVAINDPQMLAHAFMLTGLALLWRLKFSRTGAITGCALMLAGGFTKHLLVPLPVATTLWLAAHQRAQLRTWLLAGGAGLAIGCLLAAHCGGPRFWLELLSARMYSLPVAARTVLDVLRKLLPLIALSLVPYLRARRGAALSDAARFLWPYQALSLAIGAVACGGEGTNRNVFFDFMIASSMAAAFGLDALLRLPPWPRLRGLSPGEAVLLLLGSVMTGSALTEWPQAAHELRELDATERDTQRMVALIRQRGQSGAACEQLQLCYWAHVPFRVDFFNYGEKLRTGLLPVASCTDLLRQGAFPVLALQSPLGTTAALWRCGDDIPRSYTLILRNRAGSVLVPAGNSPPPKLTSPAPPPAAPAPGAASRRS
jgi:hypothetical protein